MLQMPPFRDSPTRWGGVVRYFANGTHAVIVRDFGLTNEPECSEEAHAQMLRWMRENHPEFESIPIPMYVPNP